MRVWVLKGSQARDGEMGRHVGDGRPSLSPDSLVQLCFPPLDPVRVAVPMICIGETKIKITVCPYARRTHRRVGEVDSQTDVVRC